MSAPYHSVWYGFSVATKNEWIEEAFRVITEKGLSHLTIDLLAANLNLSKGSFYHHFKNLASFKAEMLAHFEWVSTTSLITMVEEGDSQTPMQKLERLVELGIEPSPQIGLQVAVRAWATQDPEEVRVVQERLDRVRLDYASSLWREAGCSPEESDFRALHLYLVLIGGRQLYPTLSTEQLREICRRVISAPF
jgi:AcrR family transcriptional regulator